MVRTKAVVKYLGFILLFNALFLLISAIISLAYGEDSVNALLVSALITAILGLLPQFFSQQREELKYQEGLIISVLGWILTCITGMLPYYFWGGEFTLANAFFESVSGYTTTGGSVLSNVEGLTKGLLFWRSSTTFIGGVGIILFVLLILPEKKRIQASIYRSEVSGLSKMNFQTRSRYIVRIIVTVYFTLIISCTLLLKIAGMTFFDAICHSFSVIATAGFSTKNLSIAAFDNIWIEVIIMFFMLISSMHFGLIFATMTGKKINILTSRPTQMYVVVTIIGIILIALQLTHENLFGLGASFRYASFQVISLVSTTGLATVDTAHWPMFSIFLLLYYSVQCGMVGSTAGGIKFDRIYLFFGSLKKQLKMIIHPDGMYAVKMDHQIVNHTLELQIMIFIIIYLFTMMFAALLLTLMGIDGMTSLSASIATIGNVGPGFGEVSSLGNYGGLPDAAKYVLSVNMLLGRLEIMNIFAIFLLFLRKS